MPWLRKKVVNDLESTLIVRPFVRGSPLFCISRSALNSLPTSHLIVTIPNWQRPSVWSRSGHSGQVVGLTGSYSGQEVAVLGRYGGKHPTAPFRGYFAGRWNIVFEFAVVGFGVELSTNSRKTRCCTDCT